MASIMGALMALLACLLWATPSSSAAHGQGSHPGIRLVLQITVDQLRGDLLDRFARHFGKEGFLYLEENGLLFANAHHEHANTETIVGHATLATGAYPAVHGMVGNVWFDREEGRLVYNIEDSQYQLVTAGADVDRDTEIDPTQALATTEGRSPTAILVSTFGDELAVATGGKAKIFGVSVKDRGAVAMAGHAGTAYWFSKATGEFVTSTYYMDANPDWVARWNAADAPSRYANTAWNLSGDASHYLFGSADDSPWETNFPGYGRTFPHAYGAADGKYFTTLLTLSPAGDELTADFVMALIENEEVGADEVPDYLSVSFSATDYVGHLFGPSSLEAEDNLARLDRTLARLLTFVDDKVGLDHTLIVLSADHGAPDVPGYLNELGIPADFVDPNSWDTSPGIAALKARFGLGQELIREYFHPYIYLDHDLIQGSGLDSELVERAVAAELTKLDGVATAVSSRALRNNQVPETPLMRAILYNFNAKRSGDIFVVFEPNRFINEFDRLSVASTHGSPWRYDTFVPIVFAGPGIPIGRVHRRVSPNDIAPTLAALMRTKPPSGASGNPLVEVVKEGQ